jgi:sec-independent protein translocase protein TatC
MDAQETFISHLIELRTRLLRSVIAVMVLFVALFFWPGSSVIYDWLAQPLMQALPEGSKMIATGVTAPFFVPMKVTGVVALVLALPFVLYQIWAFVAPALYIHERRLGLPLVIASTLLFVSGMAFCYYFVFGKVFIFINQFAPKSITPAPDIENYLNFVLTMFLAFGVAFEIPVVVVVLARMGIVSVQKLTESRRYVILANFIIAAIVTPPDVMSQLLLAIPMCLLYEVGILAARFVVKPSPVQSDFSPLTEEEMEKELDGIEAAQKKSAES